MNGLVMLEYDIRIPQPPQDFILVDEHAAQ